MPAPDLAYDVVDVFTDRPFSGNQLAVVHGATALTDDQRLAITREFGYAETTFPAPASPTAYAVRIWTPAGEVPFAGHPTLGTAWVLRERGELDGAPATQHCGAGDVAVDFPLEDLVALATAPRDLAGPVPAPLVHAVLADHGLRPDDLAGEAWVAGAGLDWVHLPVTAEALARARTGTRPITAYDGWPALADPLEGVNLVAVGAGDPLPVHARVLVPGPVPAEDAATGSAAAGLGMALVVSGVLADGGAYEVRQGAEVGRPSRLSCRVEAEDGVPTRCHVAGRVQPVARGRIRVPPPA